MWRVKPVGVWRYELGALLLLMAHTAWATVLYVDVNGANPAPPFTNWLTAATNIQDAVDLANPGDQVLVTNGVYQAGGIRNGGQLTNRVAIWKPIVLQSVNGPAVTLIVGAPAGTNRLGVEAVRCVAMTNGSILSGFTLTNGATLYALTGPANCSGGGVYGDPPGGLVSNCVIVGNCAVVGGGALGCTLSRCVISNNAALPPIDSFSQGGGAALATLYDCYVGGNTAFYAGGMHTCVASNCLIADNIAKSGGGGCIGGTLVNCSLVRNVVRSGSLSMGGGGAYTSALIGCSVVSNTASLGGGMQNGSAVNCIFKYNQATNGRGSGSGGGMYFALACNCLLVFNSAVSGGGAFGGALTNCTVVSNSARDVAGASLGTLANCILRYNYGPQTNEYNYLAGDSTHNCCTFPIPTNGYFSGNITNEPGFANAAAGDFHLGTGSPCVNSGNNYYATALSDLDGAARISGGTVDIGAYEFQDPASLISYAWLDQYAFANDGSADHADPDQDGMDNWQEWIAGTDPTSSASVLKMLSASNSFPGVTLTWNSVTTRLYYVERVTNPVPPLRFVVIKSNLAGEAQTTSFTDTNTVGLDWSFYRVGVRE